MAGGRPSKLTPEKTKEICDIIRLGVTPLTAAQSCGIAKATFYLWQQKARDAKRANKYTEFMDNIEEAKANAIQKCITDIYNAKDWKAKAWLAEHLDRFNYGAVQKLEVESKVKVDIFQDIDDLEKTLQAKKDPEVEEEPDH